MQLVGKKKKKTPQTPHKKNSPKMLQVEIKDLGMGGKESEGKIPVLCEPGMEVGAVVTPTRGSSL